MLLALRRKFIIIGADFLIALFAFWIARYFGDLPRWYWLVLLAVIWVILGVVSGKLQFGSYKKVRNALLGIVVLDILSGLLLCLLFRYCVASYECDYSILLATVIIIFLEWGLYGAVRKLVYRKIPFFYEEPLLEGPTEVGLNNKSEEAFDMKNQDIDRLLQIIKECKNPKEVIQSIISQWNLFAGDAILLDSSNPESILVHKTKYPSLIIHTRSLNEIRHLNTFLSYSNYCLDTGKYIFCHCTTAGTQRERILKQNPPGVNYLLYFLDYNWHRVCAKLSITKSFYFWVTGGKKRVLTRVEVLGRFYRAGFDVIHEDISNGEFYVIASKKKDPIRDDKPSNGLLIRLRRIGKDGNIIGVYKFRTMFAYSEYLQPYIYKQEGLDAGGKIAGDYRVNKMGKFLRSAWLDELPMLINWIKGDLKLVGVRPLSDHYFSLYSKELQELRIKTKPGLVPPFYADMPATLEEIQESEWRYLRAYFEKPLITDWRYFWRALWNIVVRRERSK